MDKNKFANASEDVDIDDTEEQVANTIRRLEVLQEKEKEKRKEQKTHKEEQKQKSSETKNVKR